MIAVITLVLGMVLFQILVTLEAWRQFARQMNRSLSIQWFTIPKTERPFMRRTPGVMTVENDPSKWKGIIK